MNKADLRKSHIGRRAVQPAGTACAKDLGQDRAWFFRGAGRRPAWLERSERGGEGDVRGREGVRTAVQGPWAAPRSGFYQGQWGALEGFRQ